MKAKSNKNFKLYEKRSLESMASLDEWKKIPLKAKKALIKVLWDHLNEHVKVKGAGIDGGASMPPAPSVAPTAPLSSAPRFYERDWSTIPVKPKVPMSSEDKVMKHVGSAIQTAFTAKAGWDLLKLIGPAIF